MITRKEYEDGQNHGRIDALAKVLGYTWDEETRKYNKTGRAVVAEAAEATVPTRSVCTNRRKRGKGEALPREFYAALAGLTHGESLDITEAALSVRATAYLMYQRIYSHFHQLPGNKSFQITENRGVITATRR